jgi:N-dimethylarginine dimethylaminohydrolase
MTPWGHVQLRPRAAHRLAEAEHVADYVTAVGSTLYHRIDTGWIEGGDVCLIQEGLVALGHSGERTDDVGAQALTSVFNRHGWDVIRTRFHPKYLHLDTIFTMAAPGLALACIEALKDRFVEEIRGRGIEILPISADEVQRLSGNCLSIGQSRVVVANGSDRIIDALTSRGVHVIDVRLDQFTRCGGGPHCLTFPLARLSS